MAILHGGIDAAKAYARRGWRVVILHGSAGGVCTCRKGGNCPSPAKHPRLTRWHEQATSDEAEIEQLFAKWPSSNLGVRLGPSSGIVDVEFDDAEGKATAERLLGDIQTPTFNSHRSTHRLFRFPDGLSIPTAVVKAKGLEMRFGTETKGSQSVFPPSVHASGIQYEWVDGLSPDDVELAAFPDSLVQLLTSPEANGNGELEFTMQDGSESLSTHGGASDGERNTTLCRLVGAYLKAHGPDSGLPTHALAWAKRCSPPMDDAEVSRIVSELANKELGKGIQPGEPKHIYALETRRYSDIESKPIEWLWPNRFALGKLSLLVGQPGLGKTFLACDLAARVSRGIAFPDGPTPPAGDAVILTAEDSASDTLRPRLDAAGADVARVHHVDGIRSDTAEHFVDLGKHLQAIDTWLKQHPDAKLLVIDPISAFLGNVDSHRNGEVRAILGPVADLAERHHIAIIGITHLSKGQAKAINRIIGSIAFVAAARATWMIAADPDDGERRLLLPVKNNIGKAGGLAYRLVGDERNTHIEWDESPVLISADDIDADDQSTPLGEAIEWLNVELADAAVPASAVLKKAKSDGIAERTLKRAKAELGIVSEREGKAWVWRLPDQEPPDTDGDCFIVT